MAAKMLGACICVVLQKDTHADRNVNVARQFMCRDSATHVNVTGHILRIRESVLEEATPLSLHLRRRTMFVCLAMYWPLRHVFTVSW